jgi:hypothetical protein
MRPPHQSTTLSYANMSKMRPPYNSLHTTGVHYINHHTFSYQLSTKSITTLFLYKSVKNASHFFHTNCPPYQSLNFSYTKVPKMRHTFFIPTVHHMISLHFCYTKVSKMRPLYDTTLSNAYLPHSQVSIWCLCISN